MRVCWARGPLAAGALVFALAGCASSLASPQAQQRDAAIEAAAAAQSCRFGLELHRDGKTTKQQVTVLLADMQREVGGIGESLARSTAESGQVARNRAELLGRIGAAQSAIIRARDELAGAGAGGGTAPVIAQLDEAALALRQWEPR